jgi:hypothetical protein
LGTGGGPRPRAISSASALVIVSNNVANVIVAAMASLGSLPLRDFRCLLVHSVMYPSAIDRLVTRMPNAAALKASILAHQTSAEDVGRIAQAASIKTLVLSHVVPPDDPAVTDAMWKWMPRSDTSEEP